MIMISYNLYGNCYVGGEDKLGSFFYGLYNILKYSFNFWLDVLKKGDNDLALTLIGGMLTLISLYFVFLPLLVENQKKNIYLGYRISDWLLYERKRLKFFSDIAVSWIVNIVLIMTSIIFICLKWYNFVLFMFYIFLIYITYKITQYLRYTSDDDVTHKEIENNFLLECNNDIEKAIKRIKKNISVDIEENRKTLQYLLSNFDKDNVNLVFDALYHILFKSNNKDNVYMLFLEIANAIINSKYTHQACVQPWDLHYLLVNILEDNNEDNIHDILHSIIANNINVAFGNNNKYNEILAISYKAIDENKYLSDKNKDNFKESILDSIKYSLYSEEKKDDFIKYKYIFNFFKYVVDYKDDKGIDYFMDVLDCFDYSNDNAYKDVLISMMIYLYYLIVLESEPYVKEDEKEFLTLIHQRLLNIIEGEDYQLQVVYQERIDVLFKYIEESSRFWERLIFKHGTSMKTPICDNAILSAKRALYIYFKKDIIGNIKNINDNDLDAFRYTFEKDNIKDDIKDRILKFISFMGLEISQREINNYEENLLEYANIKYKNEDCNDKNIDFYKEHFKKQENSIIKETKKLQIFNNKDTEHDEVFNTKPQLATIGLLDTYLNNDLNKWIKVDSIIEKWIYKYLSEKIVNKVGYYYNDDKAILNKLSRINSKYYYLRPNNDDLGNEYKFGDKYNNLISKLEIINTTVGSKRFLIKDFACRLNDIKIIIRELSNNELKIQLKEYKITNNKYCIVNSYGFNCYYTKKEFEEYYRKNYFVFYIVFHVGIDVIDNRGYEFFIDRKLLK